MNQPNFHTTLYKFSRADSINEAEWLAIKRNHAQCIGDNFIFFLFIYAVVVVVMMS